jgi:hypothetical protein
MLTHIAYDYTSEVSVAPLWIARDSFPSQQEGLRSCYRGIMCTSCSNGIVYADSCCQVSPHKARPNDDYCLLGTGKKFARPARANVERFCWANSIKAMVLIRVSILTGELEKLYASWVPGEIPSVWLCCYSRQVQYITTMSKVSHQSYT